ncbi:MAG TPA: hypothetical protein VMK12_32975 [Anaeromyxobacteraceae bacterium]|nr:hypothetical protein [Anaeromyxobacteraceae bacterium]
MLRDVLALFTNAWELGRGGRQDEAPVPEPEFKPFRFPEREGVGARAGQPSAAGAGGVPRTLAELGVPSILARDIESALNAMGAIRGGRVMGFKFRTSDGASHPLRLSASPRPDQAARAA